MTRRRRIGDYVKGRAEIGREGRGRRLQQIIFLQYRRRKMTTYGVEGGKEGGLRRMSWDQSGEKRKTTKM